MCAVVVLSCLCCIILSLCHTDVPARVPQVCLFACVASDKMLIWSGRDVVVALCQQIVCTSKAGGGVLS